MARLVTEDVVVLCPSLERVRRSMRTFLFGTLGKFFPVQPHEWPKALMLLSVATLLGIGFTVSRSAAEAMFLIHFGVESLPYLLLVNPLLVLLTSAVYGAYADRLPDNRLMIYSSLLPVPLIMLLHLGILLHIPWAYFALYAFVLAYGTILTTSWTVYMSGHYDVQESKRLIPFISSGMLIGTVLGGVGVALCVPLVGTEGILWLWSMTLVGGVVVIRSITRRYTTIDTKAHKPKRAAPKPSLRQSIAEGIAYSRSSTLFTTTAIASITTMMVLQIIDFEYSKIIRVAFPESAQLTAFLGVFDSLTTCIALLLQWFTIPWCLRRFGVQGTNLLFPYALCGTFGFFAVALGMPPVALPAAMLARFTRASLMPTLRGTTRTLMLNAVPRKTGALVRSFNTAMVMPLGQGAGALLLIMLKGVALPWLFPALGGLITGVFVVYSYKQNVAYGEALLELLKEDRIHLLDLEVDDMRQLDTTAVAAISARLTSEQEEVALAAIALLQAVGSPQARTALQQYVPVATPRAAAASLHALAVMGGDDTSAFLRPYLEAVQPDVRLAALQGLLQLGESTVRQRAAHWLDDPDVEVCAAAITTILTTPQHPAIRQARHRWEIMLDTPDAATQIAAFSVMATVPETSLQGRVYRALDHPDMAVRHAALRVLEQLALAGRLGGLDSALLRSLEADDVDSRVLALHVLAVLDTTEALEHMLILLDDDQPQVRDTLVQAVKRYGQRAVTRLFTQLQAPTTSLLAKETALLALARLEGVHADQFLAFWESQLRDVYRYKLMLASLDAGAPLDTDTFLRLALDNAHRQLLSLLVQLLAVWASPEVARLVESGLHDPDRRKRANALEALESLSDRRFTRLFLPILDAAGSQHEDWRDVAQRQWSLTVTERSALLMACLEDVNTWVVLGAVLAGQARASLPEEAWTAALTALAATTLDADVRLTVQQALAPASPAPPRAFSRTDIMLFLKRLPLYGSMSLDQLRTIATYLTECPMLPRQTIFREGDHSQDLYLIVSGKVDIIKHFGATSQTLATLQTGDFFGDMAIFEDRPRSADAVGAEAGMLLVLNPDHFRQIVLQDPAISFEIFRALSARIRRFDEETLEANRQRHESTLR